MNMSLSSRVWDMKVNIDDIVKSRTLDYANWKFKNGYTTESIESTAFRDWWSKEMQPAYTKAYWEWLESINCTEYHKLLFEDDNFFNNIHEYMTNNNWIWANSNTSPKKDEMINCILELSFASSQDEIEPVSTGGFEVTFHPKKFLTVNFGDLLIGHQNMKILYKKHIGVECLREHKLKKILNV